MRITGEKLRQIIREELGFVFLMPDSTDAVSHDSLGVNDDPKYSPEDDEDASCEQE